MFKILLIPTTLLISTLSFAGQAQIKVIYGDDNREDVMNVITPLYLKLSESTAAMISKYKIVELNSEEYSLESDTLKDSGVCSHERFADQPVAANCSGFLVGPKLLVTAGHCVKSESSCKNSSWVFDYKVEFSSQSEVTVKKSSVYKCTKIISQELNTDSENDYAVIELDREVTDKKPLKLRRDGTPSKGDSLVVIGHPSGLPTKVTDKGTVRDVNSVFMVTNLDTYGGNSGSAVFNSKTGLVEGILVRGEQDYVWDSSMNCRVSNMIGVDAGRGEDVTLISTVLSFVPKVEEPKPKPELPIWWQQFLDWLESRRNNQLASSF